MAGTVGRYTLLEKIASGGMADVYRAVAHGVDGVAKEVVLKRVRQELASNERFRTMFLDEARIAVSLGHANIVHVFELGKIDDDYFLAMEHVRGANLARVLFAAGDRLPPALVAWIGAEACRGLSYAHRKRGADGKPLGIVHRDLSPQNILCSEEGEVKIADFGIAKARGSAPTTRHGEVKGKLNYLSPEQALGKPLDGRSDLFALGTILYAALDGRNPFGGADDLRAPERILGGGVAPLGPEVPAGLAAIIRRAMELDASARQPDADAMGAELEELLASLGTRTGARELAALVRSAMGGAAPPAPVRAVDLDGAIGAVLGSADAAGESEPGVTQFRTRARKLSRRGRRWPWLALGAVVLLLLGAGGYFGFRMVREAMLETTDEDEADDADEADGAPGADDEATAAPKRTPDSSTAGKHGKGKKGVTGGM